MSQLNTHTVQELSCGYKFSLGEEIG